MQKPYRLFLPVLLFFCIAGPKAAYPKIPAEPALQTEPERAENVEGKDAALTERDFLFGVMRALARHPTPFIAISMIFWCVPG